MIPLAVVMLDEFGDGAPKMGLPDRNQPIKALFPNRLGRKVNLSHVFAGQHVGVTQVGDRISLVTFMQYDLGYFDDETCSSNRSTIRSARKCYL